jgi:hypothetical protein
MCKGGSMRNFKTVDDDELDDFYEVIDKQRLSKDDFELEELDVEEIPAGNNLFHSVGHIKITHKLNGKTKTYNSGHNSKWVADFSIDLNDGLFR